MQHQHCDPATLTAAAVDGAPLEAADRAHLVECAECAAEFAAITDIVDMGRSAKDVVLVSPPPSVWQAVEQELSQQGEGAPVTALDDRRATAPEARRSKWATVLSLGVAASFGAVIGAAITGVITSGPSGPAPTPQIVAEAQLAALPDGKDTLGSGTAKFEKDADGDDILVVDTADLEQPGGFYQVWLIDPATFRMVSVGTIGAGAQSVTFPVPAAIDPDTYSVVDISDEPMDGDPTHSKASVLRGELSV